MLKTTFGTSRSWEKLGTSHREILSTPGSWDNFRRTIASRYFTDSDYTEDDIKFTYDYLKKAGVRIDESDFAEGNPVHVEIDGKLVTQDLLVSASELHSMEKVIDFKSIKTMVEIGGGYGRMALMMLQRYPHLDYTIVDVPPAIEISRRFLAKKFTVKSVSPSELQSLSRVDLFYSSSVMSELGAPIVRSYFSTINRIGSKFYLKDWKRGHHTNDLDPRKEYVLNKLNTLSLLLRKKPFSWAMAHIDSHRINENSYP
ncbi:MAG TPA: putative sugar O-methyltransferase, partial [Kofleriaceae bacterium]|nr:putative sugar O-methyltransferase [Kofleriaceae bacterium]